jgi:hypothetical protein
VDNRGVLTSSDVHEREAYVPREPGADVQRHWPARMPSRAPRGLRIWWVGDALVVGWRLDALHAFTPRPDGLYEVDGLARVLGLVQWLEVDPPLPDGPIDADAAVDLLSGVRRTHPTLGLIVRRLDIDVLRAVLPRLTCEILCDAVDDEIAERTHGLAARLFRQHLRTLERGGSDDRDFHAHHLAPGPDPVARAAIRALVPDAGERVRALIRAERDPDIRKSLRAALRALSPADTSG